jgi:predicted glycogen debranching enzyme
MDMTSRPRPEREWLDADGRGGYAAGTVRGIPTRRYHGLLLVARHAPHERIMLVNQLAETLELASGPVVLSGVRAAESVTAWESCVSFAATPNPSWRYRFGDTLLERSILRPRGAPYVLVRWELLAGRATRLRVRPMLSGRHDHETQRESEAIDAAATVDGRAVSWQPHAAFPRVHALAPGTYRHDPEWYRGIEYPIDRERGEVAREAWWSPGEITLELLPAQGATLILSTDELSAVDGETAFQREVARRSAATPPPSGSRLKDALHLAAESYRARFTGGAAALAGFPWFDVWTRDTFTAFTGLYLTTGHFAEARAVLATFAPLVRDGMLPANLPDRWTEPRWNAADAPLLFVIGVDSYLRYTGDESVVAEFALDAVRKILDGYSAGSPRHIHVDADGLVIASAPDQALTWMDADYQGHVMTPRRGKPVELQSLWVCALGVARTMAERSGDLAFATRCHTRREAAIASFRTRFWNEQTGHLFDVVDGPEGDDATLRPNQIFALSHDEDLLPHDVALRVLEVVDRRLRTPFGLRTLAADDPNYHPQYVGNQAQRDPAYHQGTVWPFLLGPFVTAWVRLHGGTQEVRRQALGFLGALEQTIDGEGCFGHLPEVFDGDPPHLGRGCFAQAWSAGALLAALDQTIP